MFPSFSKNRRHGPAQLVVSALKDERAGARGMEVLDGSKRWPLMFLFFVIAMTSECELSCWGYLPPKQHSQSARSLARQFPATLSAVFIPDRTSSPETKTILGFSRTRSEVTPKYSRDITHTHTLTESKLNWKPKLEYKQSLSLKQNETKTLLPNKKSAKL